MNQTANLSLSASKRTAGHFVDALIFLGLILVFMLLEWLPPIPALPQLLLIAVLFIPFVVAQKFLLGETFGIRLIFRFGFIGKTVVAAFLISIFFLSHILINRHPLTRRIDVQRLDAFVPSNQDGTRWSIQPFYYAIGAWPTQLTGEPVLFSVPYQKGPPRRFVGQVQARIKGLKTNLTITGPKTPVRDLKTNQLQHCLTTQTLSCLKIRNQVLSKHIRELQKIRPHRWTLSWFDVDNSAIRDKERPQGIHIQAVSMEQTIDRYILVNPKGAHQTFTLKRQTNETDPEIRQVLEKVVRSIRISDSLLMGRSWLAQTLSQINLKEALSLKDNREAILRLTQFQTQLISRITVNPSEFDAYFHLAGTSHLIYKKAVQMGHGSSLSPLTWAATVKSTIRSSLKYTQDIKPGDRRIEHLKSIWEETLRN